MKASLYKSRNKNNEINFTVYQLIIYLNYIIF